MQHNNDMKIEMGEMLHLLWKMAQLSRYSSLGGTKVGRGNEQQERLEFCQMMKVLIDDAAYCKKCVHVLVNQVNDDNPVSNHLGVRLGLNLATYVEQRPPRVSPNFLTRKIWFKECLILLQETDMMNIILQTLEPTTDANSWDGTPLIKWAPSIKKFEIEPTGMGAKGQRKRMMIEYIITVVGKSFPQVLDLIGLSSLDELSKCLDTKMELPHMLALCYSLHILYADVQIILDCFQLDHATETLDCMEVCNMILAARDKSRLKGQEDYGEDDDICTNVSMNMASVIVAECFKSATDISHVDAELAGMSILSAFENEDLYFLAARKLSQSVLFNILESHRKRVETVLGVTPPTVFSECIPLDDEGDFENHIHIEPFSALTLWKIMLNTVPPLANQYIMWLIVVEFTHQDMMKNVASSSCSTRKETRYMHLCISRKGDADQQLLWAQFDIDFPQMYDYMLPKPLDYEQWNSKMAQIVVIRPPWSFSKRKINVFQLGYITLTY